MDDGATVVATHWFGNEISVIDAAARAVVRERTVGATAAHVLSPPGSGVVWVSIEGSHYLEALDPHTWGFLPRRVLLGGNMPHGLGWGGGKVLVANSMTDNASIVDVAASAEVGLAPAGRYPLGAAVTPDGAVGLVGNCLDGTVSFLDLALATRIADVPLGGCVAQIAVNAAGTRAAVAHGDRTAILDVASRALLSDVVTGKGAHGVWMGPAADGGTFAYVTHKYDDHVAVVDVATGAHLGDVPLVHATTGRAALVGATDTGGQGVVVRLP
jgi:DNA-binding beta-propeller fold protein YncE